MSYLVQIWDQANGIAGMVTAARLIETLDNWVGGEQMMLEHTVWLIKQVNGEPPPGGWTRRHLSVALDVALEEIKEGQPGYWIAN